MDQKKLYELEELGKAEIVESCQEGTVMLWEVTEDEVVTEYVALDQSTIITREEDNEHGSDSAFFPY